MNQENWKDVAGYEGLYRVSDMGRVKSLERIVFKKMYGGGVHPYTRKARFRKFDISEDGYCTVELSKNTDKNKFKVHRIVAFTFLPVAQGKDFVNHIDNDPLNNRVSNLEWCTSAENVNHSVKQGRHAGIENIPESMRRMVGSKNFSSKLTEDQVIQIRSMKMPQRQIAKMFGVSKTAIKFVQQRKSWTHV